MNICAIVVGSFAVIVAGILYFRHRLERRDPARRQRSQGALVALGFLLAPLTPIAILCAFKLIINTIRPEPDADYQWYLVMIISALAYAATLIVAVPTYFALRAFKLIRWWSCMLAGFLMGDVAVITMSGYSLLHSPFPVWFAHVAGTLLGFGAIGAAAGVIFWAIVRPPTDAAGT